MEVWPQPGPWESPAKLQDQLLALSQKLTAAEHAAEDARLALSRKAHELSDAHSAAAAAEAASKSVSCSFDGCFLYFFLLLCVPLPPP